MTLVGKSIPRKEGRKKATGQALYVDDLKFEGMLHGVTVRSSIARGRIKNISFDQPPATAGGSDRNIPWNEFTGATAIASPDDGVTVWGSMQCPYYVHKALIKLFELPEEKIRVIQTETGGGFGGKEEYPSMIAGHAALLSWKSGLPVKMIYDRAEDMAATTKRHPSRTRHKTAVTRDGKLLAMEI